MDYFVIEGQKFVPQGDCFAALLYDSPQMRLTQYVQCKMGTPVEKGRISYRQFEKPARFVLSKDGVDHTVTSRSSFLKLFPAYKKQLKKYAKEEQLSFNTLFRAESLTELTRHADSLINKK